MNEAIGLIVIGAAFAYTSLIFSQHRTNTMDTLSGVCNLIAIFLWCYAGLILVLS